MREPRNWILGIVVAVLLILAGGVVVATVDSETASSEVAEQEETSDVAASSGLDGAKVYAWSCGSCHSERWPKERSDAEWEMIMTHMRVRANLTADQAEAVLDYLQENN